MNLYRNRYRIESTRLRGWDYSTPGLYYITIVTANRECLFGEIVEGRMILAETGILVQEEWEKLFEILKELVCEKYIIMPNHIHAIIRIKNVTEGCVIGVVVETHGRASLRPPRSLSSFVAGFKSSATKRINFLRNTPRQVVWQARFWDTIIRDKQKYEQRVWYIRDNPKNWNTRTV
jgi:putative transposase